MSNETVTLPRKLTAENGAKALLMGEFFEERKFECQECSGDIDSISCCTCDGFGMVIERIDVSWTTIKAIYDKIVAGLEIK